MVKIRQIVYKKENLCSETDFLFLFLSFRDEPFEIRHSNNFASLGRGK